LWEILDDIDPRQQWWGKSYKKALKILDIDPRQQWWGFSV
jgi:hypothetical protein